MQVKWSGGQQSASPTKRRSQTRFVTRSSLSPTVTKKPNPSYISSVSTCPLSRLLGKGFRSFRTSSVGVVWAFEDLERLCSRHALVWGFFHLEQVAGLLCTMLRLVCLLPSESSYERMVASPSTYTRVLVEEQTINIRLQLLSVCNHNPKMRWEHRNGYGYRESCRCD